MAAKRSSLQVTERYQRHMVALREKAQRSARFIWAAVIPRSLDATYRTGPLELTVSMLQKEAARLAAGYVQAYVESEVGHPVTTPLANALLAGNSYSGMDLRRSLDAVMIHVKQRIKHGDSVADALTSGKSELERTVGLAVDNVSREALATAIQQSPYILGWQRALRGTCGVCLALADGIVKEPGELLQIHPHCQCVQQPVVDPQYLGDQDPNRYEPYTGLALLQQMPPKKQDDLLTPAVATAVRTGAVALGDLVQTVPVTNGADFVRQASAEELGLQKEPAGAVAS